MKSSGGNYLATTGHTFFSNTFERYDFLLQMPSCPHGCMNRSPGEYYRVCSIRQTGMEAGRLEHIAYKQVCVYTKCNNVSIPSLHVQVSAGIQFASAPRQCVSSVWCTQSNRLPSHRSFIANSTSCRSLTHSSRSALIERICDC